MSDIGALRAAQSTQTTVAGAVRRPAETRAVGSVSANRSITAAPNHVEFRFLEGAGPVKEPEPVTAVAPVRDVGPRGEDEPEQNPLPERVNLGDGAAEAINRGGNGRGGLLAGNLTLLLSEARSAETQPPVFGSKRVPPGLAEVQHGISQYRNTPRRPL